MRINDIEESNICSMKAETQKLRARECVVPNGDSVKHKQKRALQKTAKSCKHRKSEQRLGNGKR